MKWNVYIFNGVPSCGTSGSVKVQKMSLMECFNKVFNSYYERNMRDFFSRSFSYVTKKMTVKDIFGAVENKTVFIPFSVSVCREEVIKYLDAGFSVAFMKATEFRQMQKAYKEYV